MGKDFEIRNDISPDTGNVSNDAGADYGGDLAGSDGVDLNKADDNYGYGYGYEADSTEGSVGNPFPSESEYNPNEFTSGFSNEQHDLGNQLENPDVDSANNGFSKAMEYAPPPPDYTTAELPQESAIYCDAPAHVGRNPDDIIRQINEGMGPGPENNVEQPQEPEYADIAPDPPEDMQSE